MRTAIIVAWWAALLCVLYAARLGTTFLRDSSRLFIGRSLDVAEGFFS
jgi:hypothetical protein